jgi:hypothetical protein
VRKEFFSVFTMIISLAFVCSCSRSFNRYDCLRATGSEGVTKVVLERNGRKYDATCIEKVSAPGESACPLAAFFGSFECQSFVGEGRGYDLKCRSSYGYEGTHVRVENILLKIN